MKQLTAHFFQSRGFSEQINPADVCPGTMAVLEANIIHLQSSSVYYSSLSGVIALFLSKWRWYLSQSFFKKKKSPAAVTFVCIGHIWSVAGLQPATGHGHVQHGVWSVFTTVKTQRESGGTPGLKQWVSCWLKHKNKCMLMRCLSERHFTDYRQRKCAVLLWGTYIYKVPHFSCKM